MLFYRIKLIVQLHNLMAQDTAVEVVIHLVVVGGVTENPGVEEVTEEIVVVETSVVVAVVVATSEVAAEAKEVNYSFSMSAAFD